MKIIKSKKYERDYKSKIYKLHKNKEIEKIKTIEDLILDSNNMKELMLNPLAVIYGIEKKKGNLKETYTAKINDKIRLYMKPIGDYPYNLVEIESIEFEEIDDKHYGDG